MVAGHCYVCLEEEPTGLLRHACDCRSAAVHAACLRRWIATSRRSRCGVCGEAFAFAEERTEELPTRRQRFALKALVVLSSVPLVGFFVWAAIVERQCATCMAMDALLALLSVVVCSVAARVADEYRVRTTLVFQGEVV